MIKHICRLNAFFKKEEIEKRIEAEERESKMYHKTELEKRIKNDLNKILGVACDVDYLSFHKAFTVSFSSPLTYKMLALVADYFGSDSIDIEGRHGEDSYDFGLEVELTVYNAKQLVEVKP